MHDFAFPIMLSQVVRNRDQDRSMPGRADDRPMSREEHDARCSWKKFDLEATLQNIRDAMTNERPNTGLMRSLIHEAGKYVTGLRSCEDWLKKNHPGYFERLDELEKSLKDLDSQINGGNQFSRALGAIVDFLRFVGEGVRNIPPFPPFPKIPGLSPQRY